MTGGDLGKQPSVYIVASGRNGTVYTGVTSNLPKRASEHRQGLVPGFAKQYGCKLLVWFEMHESMETAILREKRIKAGSRKAKLKLIESSNPTWRDLFNDII
jgi:putative endonuclease